MNPTPGVNYSKVIVERVPENMSPQDYLRLRYERFVFDLAAIGVTVREYRVKKEIIEAPAGRCPGLHVRLRYDYPPPTPRDRERITEARREGWENGALVRLFIQEGSPSEILQIPELELSPYRPGLPHSDREEAIVLDLAWFRGFNLGWKGERLK